jgi:outer membrane protein assembly factor BamB
VTDLGSDVCAPVALSVGVVVADGSTGRLYGFDQKTGRRIWTHEAGGPISHRPIIVNGVDGGGNPQERVVWVTSDGVAAARPFLGGNQAEVWSVDLGGPALSAPIAGLSDDRRTGLLYVAVDRPTGPVIVTIDGASGSTWELALESEPIGDFAATDTGLLFSNEEGRLMVLDTRTTDLFTACDPPSRAAAEQAPIVAGDLIAVPYDGGEMGLFRTCTPGYDFGKGLQVQPQLDMDLTRRPAIVDQTFVYVGQRALNRYAPAIWDPERHILELEDLQTQEQREAAAEILSELFPWEDPYLLEDEDSFSTNPVISGDLVLIGTELGLVLAIDLETGLERWRYELDGRIVEEIAAVDGALFVTTSRGILFAIGGPPGPEGITPVEPGPFPEGREPAPSAPDEEDSDSGSDSDSDSGSGDTTTTLPPDAGEGDDGSDDAAPSDKPRPMP